jgi:uncharacterized membrane protein
MRSSLLALHIASGIAALIGGTGAMIFRKGSDRHRLYGNIFVVSMLALGISAAILAFAYTHETGNFIGGIFTVYLVGTAWMTARRHERKAGPIEWAGLGFIVILAAVMLWGGIRAILTEANNGGPAIAGFFLGFIALFCAIGDIRVMARGICGAPRIARHLWRMCFALFIASGSFFLGRIRIFPHLIRELYIPWIFAFLPLFLLIFWLIRVRLIQRPSLKITAHAA